MTWTPLDPPWRALCARVGVDAAALWASSGGAWLTDPRVAVPDTVVRSVVAMVQWLDARGAGLADLLGAEGVGVVGERAAIMQTPPATDISCGGATRLLPAADGWVAVSLPRPDDIDSIPAWLGATVGDDPWVTVADAIATRTTGELVERASMLGLAVAGVGEETDGSEVLLHRVGDLAPTDGDLELRGVVVANLASLWAGPLAGDVLARLGARVITVESIGRPDGGRQVPEFFDALHGRHESVALDFTTAKGRRQLGELLGAADVVIEGSRPRALEQLGIDAAALTRTGPRIWASITAHGRTGSGAARIGYGDDAAAAGGLVGWVAGSAEGRPVFLADAIADPIAGLTTAATIVYLLERGGRWIADIALSRLAASLETPSPAALARCDPSLVRPPRRRADPGRPLPLGRDTASVLREFGIEA